MGESSQSSDKRKLASQPIAIVGLSALFPKARNLQQYWSNIVDARDCIDEVPESHWRIADYYDPNPNAEDKTYCRRGGFLPDIAFNPLEFGIPPNTLEVTDVLQLLALVTARNLLMDAGCLNSPKFNSARTGVILGITGANSLTQPLSARLQTPLLKQVVRSCGLSDRDAEEIAEKFKKAYVPWQENSFPGMLGNVVAGRIANRFNLGGTNCTVDAACASSLAAVKMAVSELREGRADLMLTGGCDAENTILMYMCFSKTPAFSKSGQIRPFDTEADGTLIGEGLGMVALKRLEDAERDADRIYAVIRGVGTSSDGRFKSIYAPRKEGQMVALKRAYDDADCAPRTIGLIEAHGTGTAVGDLTELAALSEVYREATADKQFAAIGSVKSQIGHTKAAAGAAGLIKLALSLHHKILPPTLHVTKPSEDVGFESTAFYLNSETRPWIRSREGFPRRAALSSFGFGGTNFHLVLEEHATTIAGAALHDSARSFVWSAPEPKALIALLRSQKGAFDRYQESDAIVPTHARIGFVATTSEEHDQLLQMAIDRLTQQPQQPFTHPKGIFYRTRSVDSVWKVAGLFAGQGSQYVNMGREAALRLPLVREAFDRMNGHFQGTTPLSEVVFPKPSFGRVSQDELESRLRRTDCAQPAIGALSFGHYTLARSLGLKLDAAIGHSFGELTALWAAGCLDDASYLTLACARGAAMAPPREDASFDAGTMAAISATQQQLQGLLAHHQEVRLCNYNSPTQLVVGGATAAVERFVKACDAAGIKARKLPVSAAFHTPLVGHSIEGFRKAVQQVRFAAPRFDVLSNTDARPYTGNAAEDRSLLAEQLLHPVCFQTQVERLHQAGHRVFVEFGPKGVLSKLVESILTGREFVCVAFDAGPGKSSELAVKQACLQLKLLGLPLQGLNCWSHVEPAAQPDKGMVVMLNGINYVSPERKKAFQAALQSGYRIRSSTEVSPATPEPLAQSPHVEVELRPTGSARATALTVSKAESISIHHPPGSLRGRPGATESMSQNKRTSLSDLSSPMLSMQGEVLGVHSRFMDGQLHVASRLTDVLGRTVNEGHGTADSSSIAGITQVAQHSIQLGQVHNRSNEVFLAMMKLLDSNTLQNSPGVASVSVARPAEPHRRMSSAVNEVPLASAQAIAGAAQRTVEVSAPASQLAPNGAVVLALDAVRCARQQAPVSVAGVPNISAAQLGVALMSIIAETTGYPAEMLDENMDMEGDLGIDSIKRVQILGALSDRFPSLPTLKPESMGEIRTLKHIRVYLESQFQLNVAASTDSGSPQVQGDVSPFDQGSLQAAVSPEASHGISRLQVALKVLERPERILECYAPGSAVVIVDDGSEAARCMAESFSERGWKLHLLRMPSFAGSPTASAIPGALVEDVARFDGEAVKEALQRLAVKERSLALCLYFLTGSDWNEATALDHLKHALLVAKYLQRTLEQTTPGKRAGFITVTQQDGLMGFDGCDGASPICSGVSGLVKTLGIEAPRLFCRTLDFSKNFSNEALVAAVWGELEDVEPGLREVGYSRDGRRTLTLVPTRSEGIVNASAVHPLTREDVLVVTGGARGVTATCLIELARAYPCELILLGRTHLAERPTWASAGGDEASLKRLIIENRRAQKLDVSPKRVDQVYRCFAAQEEIRHTVDGLNAAGARAHYLCADIGDEPGLRQVLAPWNGRITGLVHGAGVLADKLIVDKSLADLNDVMAPKVAGLKQVMAVLDAEPLKHVVLFSSVAGFFGNRGQSDYAMANEVLNKQAFALKARRPSIHVTSINWGAWDGGMVSAQLKKMFAERGIVLIGREVGARMFVEQFQPDRQGDVVVVIGPDAPLSFSTPGVHKGTQIKVVRGLDGMANHGLLADHALNGVPVIPVTYALGAIINLLEKAMPGTTVVHCDAFQVLNGLVLDGQEPKELICQMEVLGQDDRGVEVSAHLSSHRGPISRKHYGLHSARLAFAQPEAQIIPGLLEKVCGLDNAPATTVYVDGSLFHGPGLQGIEAVVEGRDGEFAFRAALRAEIGVAGGYGGTLFHPALADLLLQATLVAARRVTGLPGLPLSVGQVHLYRPLQAGQSFYILVDQVKPAEQRVRCRVRSCDSQGHPYLGFDDVSIQLSKDLASKFVRRAG